MAAQRPQSAISHPTAVLIIASVATVWGFARLPCIFYGTLY